MGKLEDTLVYRFRPEDGQPRFLGKAHLADSEFATGYELVKEPQVRDPGYRRQTADEYLDFGAETMNAKDFDAEILVTLGRGEEAEVYTIFMERDELMSYLSFARSISTFVPEHTPRDVNGIVVLSTCSYEYDDARYVVACAPVMFD